MPELVLFRRGEEVLRVILERRRMVLGSGERSDMVLADPQKICPAMASGGGPDDKGGRSLWPTTL
jgi:hypothetical protein